MDKIDMVLLMSVNPGFGGQSFIGSAMDKLRQVRQLIDDSGLDIRLEIDGGVKVDNIAEIKAAGADTFVSGSGIFGKGKDSDPHRYDSVIAEMRSALAGVHR
jgi:ribulose-phosphate 3-epimerase